MQYWFNAAVTSGSLVALITACQIGYGALKWSSEEELKTWPKRLLGQPWLRPVLLILLVLSVLLNLITSSLYIQYAGAKSDEHKCVVEIIDTSANKPLVERPITVNSVYQMAGERFFFRFRSATLKFELKEPRGHDPRTEKFGWLSAILLRAPVDFPEKQFHLLRIVFGPRLWGNLPELNDEASTLYDLEISIGGRRTEIADVRRQTIIVGAGKDDLEDVLKREDPNERKNAFVKELAALAFPGTTQPTWISEWETKRRTVATDEHAPDEPIDIVLRRHGDEIPVAREQTQKTLSAPIQTVLLEIR